MQIFVKITNGFGNQLFQFAMGKTLAAQFKMKLFLDTSFYENIDYPFLLGETKAKFNGIRNINYNEYPSITLKGWWENVNCIRHFPRQTLIEEYSLRKEYKSTLLDEIKNVTSVGIHVRRDHDANLHRILGKEYYMCAVREMNKRFENCKFYIFTDNPGWVISNLSIPNSTLVEGNLPQHDFELMKNCKHNIIANSTFSFWAAYLNVNENHVICPNYWSRINPMGPTLPHWQKVSTLHKGLFL